MLGLLALVGFLAGDAHAYRDIQIIDQDLQDLQPGDSIGGVFDIVNPGSDCGLFAICDEGGYQVGEELRHVRANFLFADIGPVEASIVLGPDGGPNQGTDFDQVVILLGLATLELNPVMLDDLTMDGQIAWRLTNVAGLMPSLASTAADCTDPFPNYQLKAVSLETSVPEPSAALLFCLGFGVVGTATRARRKP
jgi:hypothetical protein